MPFDDGDGGAAGGCQCLLVINGCFDEVWRFVIQEWAMTLGGCVRLLSDQLGRSVWVPDDPYRIVSVVPSQTELLCDLGARARLVGVTRYCVHPPGVSAQACKVGGTKRLDHAVIRQLSPDLIIANKEENSREDIEKLFADYPVWVSDVRTLEDACWMIQQLGVLVNAGAVATQLVAEIRQNFVSWVCNVAPRRVAYLIWRKPYMAAGRDTFIHEMLVRCGYINVFESLPERYPKVSAELLSQMQPDEVLLSSEPFPFVQRHVVEVQRILPAGSLGRWRIIFMVWQSLAAECGLF